MTKLTKTTAARKTNGKASIKPTVAKVRAENAKAHERRTEVCGPAAAKAESVVLTADGQVIDAAAVAEPKGKARKLSLTSRAKMGAAKTRRVPAQAKVEAAERKLRVRHTNRAAKLAGLDWSSLKGIDAAKAQQYAEMLASGEGITAREAETATGLVMAQRWKVEKVLGAAGYKLRFERNPERDRSDKLTANLYRIERASA